MTRQNNEIPVRRREGGVPWWAWLLGLAALALLFLLLTGALNNNNNGQSGTSPSPALTTPEVSVPVEESPAASPSVVSSWNLPGGLTVAIAASAAA